MRRKPNGISKRTNSIENGSNANANEGYPESEVSDASHREPITQVSWLFNLAESSKQSNRAAAYNVVSLGSDGRVLVWNWLKMVRV